MEALLEKILEIKRSRIQRRPVAHPFPLAIRGSHSSWPGCFPAWLPARPTNHLSKTHNTYARKIDNVLALSSGGRLVCLWHGRWMYRTETLYILQGGKNIMYYTLPICRQNPLWRRDRDFRAQNRLSVMYLCILFFVSKNRRSLLVCLLTLL